MGPFVTKEQTNKNKKQIQTKLLREFVAHCPLNLIVELKPIKKKEKKTHDFKQFKV